MTDSPTERLSAAFEGRYRIVERLGEGGMAVVYLAEDLKHGRKVAIKVLKPELAAMIGGERFLSEIQTTANLQHPNILGLYDSGNEGGILYYVMPYVEGESLREWIGREKQLSVSDALRVAKAVASALQFAHDRGVIHRDIKPENILIQAGQPVVADFGIALAISAAGGGRMTETGLSLGTPHYMSPEQATADRDLSARSDVYALACVVYEMLAGAPPHAAPTAQASLMKILTEDAAPVSRLRRSVPAHVDAALLHALEKLPADRIESAAAFSAALDDENYDWTPPARTRVDTVQALPVRRDDGDSRGRTRVPAAAWGVAAVVLLGVGISVGALLAGADPSTAAASVEFEYRPSSHEVISPCCGRFVAVSPQGDRVVYQAVDDAGTWRLYSRRMDQREGTVIPGTEQAGHPFFSPDGQWIGYFADDQAVLYRTRLNGGSPQRIASRIGAGGSSLGGASWAPDNTIVFADRFGSGLHRVSADGGQPVAITELDRDGGEAGHRLPHVLPDGRNVLFAKAVSVDGQRAQQIWTVPLEGGESRFLMAGTDPRYVEPGWLVYADPSGEILAREFDAGSLRLGERRIRLAVGATYRGESEGLMEYDVSPNGVLAYRAGAFTLGAGYLSVVDSTGASETLLEGRVTGGVRVSPSGRWIAYGEYADGGSSSRSIWVYDLERGVRSRVSFEEGIQMYPDWASDDVIWYNQSQQGRIVARNRDGTGEPEVRQEDLPGFVPLDLSPDGEWFAWTPNVAGAGNDVWVRPVDDPEGARAFVASPTDEMSPSISPDGRWIAYVSEAAGDDDVYVEPFPEGGRRYKVSADGARSPGWSRDGSRLFYRKYTADRSDSMTVVDVRVTEEGFSTGPSRTLFSMARFPSVGDYREWDLLPDGRFVIVGLDEATQDNGTTMVVVTGAVDRVLAAGGN